MDHFVLGCCKLQGIFENSRASYFVTVGVATAEVCSAFWAMKVHFVAVKG